MDLVFQLNNTRTLLVDTGVCYGDRNDVDTSISDHVPIIICVNTQLDKVKNHIRKNIIFPSDPDIINKNFGYTRLLDGWYKLRMIYTYTSEDGLEVILASPESDAKEITRFGLTWWPINNVAFKADCGTVKKGTSEDKEINIGIGYNF